MKSRITFNPKRDLPYLAAVAQATLYTWAGVTLLGRWGWLPGAATGLLVSITMAYAASQYVDVAAARRRYVLAGMILLGAMSPVVVGTSMYLDLPLAISPLWRGIVGAALGLIPDVSVFLTGFVAGRGLVARVQPDAQPPQGARNLTRNPRKVRATRTQGARNPITDDAIRAHLAHNPGTTYTDIARHFGVSRAAVTRRVKALVEGQKTK